MADWQKRPAWKDWPVRPRDVVWALMVLAAATDSPVALGNLAIILMACSMFEYSA